MKWILLIAPGAIAFYCMFLRKELSAFPQFKQFYADANTFWGKVWAICGKSITLAWSYITAIVGVALNQLDAIASLVGDPNFKDQVSEFVHADPKYLGYFAIFVSVVTIAARLRSMTKA